MTEIVFRQEEQSNYVIYAAKDLTKENFKLFALSFILKPTAEVVWNRYSSW